MFNIDLVSSGKIILGLIYNDLDTKPKPKVTQAEFCMASSVQELSTLALERLEKLMEFLEKASVQKPDFSAFCNRCKKNVATVAITEIIQRANRKNLPKSFTRIFCQKLIEITDDQVNSENYRFFRLTNEFIQGKFPQISAGGQIKRIYILKDLFGSIDLKHKNEADLLKKIEEIDVKERHLLSQIREIDVKERHFLREAHVIDVKKLDLLSELYAIGLKKDNLLSQIREIDVKELDLLREIHMTDRLGVLFLTFVAASNTPFEYRIGDTQITIDKGSEIRNTNAAHCSLLTQLERRPRGGAEASFDQKFILDWYLYFAMNMTHELPQKDNLSIDKTIENRTRPLIIRELNRVAEGDNIFACFERSVLGILNVVIELEKEYVGENLHALYQQKKGLYNVLDVEAIIVDPEFYRMQGRQSSKPSLRKKLAEHTWTELSDKDKTKVVASLQRQIYRYPSKPLVEELAPSLIKRLK